MRSFQGRAEIAWLDWGGFLCSGTRVGAELRRLSFQVLELLMQASPPLQDCYLVFSSSSSSLSPLHSSSFPLTFCPLQLLLPSSLRSPQSTISPVSSCSNSSLPRSLYNSVNLAPRSYSFASSRPVQNYIRQPSDLPALYTVCPTALDIQTPPHHSIHVARPEADANAAGSNKSIYYINFL